MRRLYFIAVGVEDEGEEGSVDVVVVAIGKISESFFLDKILLERLQ